MSSKRSSKLPVDLAGFPAAEFKKAEAEGLKVAAILSRARTGPTRAQETHEYAGRNAQFMDEMQLGSARALARRIESKELVSKDEFIAMLGGRRRWVNDALRAGRLFSLAAQSGLEYFPAFFADERYDRRALGKVVRALEGLPDESKFYFFMRNSSRLKMTALEALAQGRTLEVVACALGFGAA
jgi:hypothetical protein